MYERLNQLYPNRIVRPQSINDIPRIGYMVYILIFDNHPIVIGHGKKNRAKIIFDNRNNFTSGHLKALFVRLYHLYRIGIFDRYIIECENKDEAKRIEKHLHFEIGGNNRNVSVDIRNQLFIGLEPDSATTLFLEIAIRSSFDGLSDLRKWHTDGLINDEVWDEISVRLNL
jgi:hypothetical protein